MILDANGAFIAASASACFPYARTYYRWDGPATGPVILLIHGATVPGWQFEHLVPRLTANGFRTLRLDLFGHGHSDRPAGAYPLAVFVEQVVDLLDQIAPDISIRGLGHSFGAVVLAGASERLGARLTHAALSAPMLNYEKNAPSSRFLHVPWLGELLMAVYVIPMLRRRRHERYIRINCEELAHRFDEQISRPGFGRALLSMFRAGTLGDQTAQYAQLGRSSAIKLVLSGSADAVVTAQQLSTVAQAANAGEPLILPSLEHNLLMSHPDAAAGPLVEFFLR
jgi:pimeloyl-ACP methyl ester carboxylesterase